MWKKGEREIVLFYEVINLHDGYFSFEGINVTVLIVY